MAITDRQRMPIDRTGRTHKVLITDDTTGQVQEGYITANLTEDGKVGEIFLTGFGKSGSTLEGWVQTTAILFSLALQHGELETLVRKLAHTKFPPYGKTDNSEIPECRSVPDYLIHWLVRRFGTAEQWQDLRDEDRKLAG